MTLKGDYALCYAGRVVLWLNGTQGLVMVPLDTAMASFYRLLILTMSLFAAVWSQFSMQSFCLQSSPTCAELQYHILALTAASFDMAVSP